MPQQTTSPSWETTLGPSASVQSAREYLIERNPLRLVDPVPLELVSYGLQWDAPGRACSLLHAQSRQSVGEARRIASGLRRSDPVQTYIGVLLAGFQTFEIAELRACPNTMQIYSNGEPIGRVEEDLSLLGTRWWEKLGRSFYVPRKWHVHTSASYLGVIDTPAAVSANTGDIAIVGSSGSFAVRFSKSSGDREGPATADFRRPHLKATDVVIPSRTEQLDALTTKIVFCVNLLFRMHYLAIDFGSLD